MKYSCPSTAQGCPDGSECFTCSAVCFSAHEFSHFYSCDCPQPSAGEWVSGFVGLSCPLELNHSTSTEERYPWALVDANGTSPAEPCAQLIHIIASRYYIWAAKCLWTNVCHWICEWLHWDPSLPAFNGFRICGASCKKPREDKGLSSASAWATGI